MDTNSGFSSQAAIPSGLSTACRSEVYSSEKNEDKEAIDYFYIHLARILKFDPTLQYHVVLQRPGETIYVPGGWWHAVLNLTDTMALTQNYVNPINFESVWRSLRITRKLFSEYFLRNLRKKNTMIYHRAKMINQRDQFVMSKDQTGRNFVEDFSTTSVETSSDSSSSHESDYELESDEISDFDDNDDRRSENSNEKISLSDD
jgi:histone arginine demethylase JMJD6